MSDTFSWEVVDVIPEDEDLIVAQACARFNQDFNDGPLMGTIISSAVLGGIWRGVEWLSQKMNSKNGRM